MRQDIETAIMDRSLICLKKVQRKVASWLFISKTAGSPRSPFHCYAKLLWWSRKGRGAYRFCNVLNAFLSVLTTISISVALSFADVARGSTHSGRCFGQVQAKVELFGVDAAYSAGVCVKGCRADTVLLLPVGKA
ncbi:hypothetical protein FY136_21745 [Agrobacterium tumefaciens]|uniref:hypothetical protein n=1 Tax=Agrobacterium tumefaciens TaxID=358 RepID=UPI0021CECE00|nr:hypothetical protein [Agrobacterium tumefaciens]UXT51849.1 hypothetical protein FY136_21745 [Agrobacterium tumefaciens]